MNFVSTSILAQYQFSRPITFAIVTWVDIHQFGNYCSVEKIDSEIYNTKPDDMTDVQQGTQVMHHTPHGGRCLRHIRGCFIQLNFLLENDSERR